MNVMCVIVAACIVVYAVFIFAFHVCCSGLFSYNSLLGWLLQTKMHMTQKINVAFKTVIYVYRAARVKQQDV
jgi:hypothetical protein